MSSSSRANGQLGSDLVRTSVSEFEGDISLRKDWDIRNNSTSYLEKIVPTLSSIPLFTTPRNARKDLVMLSR